MICQQRLCFVDIMYYFEKERIYTLEKQKIDKMNLQKGLTVCEKRAVKQVQRHA